MQQDIGDGSRSGKVLNTAGKQMLEIIWQTKKPKTTTVALEPLQAADKCSNNRVHLWMKVETDLSSQPDSGLSMCDTLTKTCSQTSSPPGYLVHPL